MNTKTRRLHELKAVIGQTGWNVTFSNTSWAKFSRGPYEIWITYSKTSYDVDLRIENTGTRELVVHKGVSRRKIGELIEPWTQRARIEEAHLL